MTSNSIELPPHTGSHTVEISAAITFRWSHGGKIGIIELFSSAPEAIDLWIEVNSTVIEQVRTEDRLYLVQNVSHPDITITPYVREAIRTLNQQSNALNLEGGLAIIMPQNPLTGMIRFAMDQRAKRELNLPRRAFFTETEALAWLESMLPRCDSSPAE